MKILALDFDGVIFNSLKEIFVTGFNAYVRLFPKTKLLDGKRITYQRIKEGDIFQSELFQIATELRNYVNAGDDMVAMFKSIDDKKQIKDQKEFDNFLKGFSKEEMKKFEKEFYDERKRLMKENLEEWYKLSPPFEIITNKLKVFKDKTKVYIVTSKDKDSVFTLCKRNNLDIKEENILDRYSEKNKLNKLLKIKENLGIKEEDIYFVDDMLLHLLPIKQNSNINCLLATWGFNNKEQRKQAEKADIKLLKQKDFIKLLSGI